MRAICLLFLALIISGCGAHGYFGTQYVAALEEPAVQSPPIARQVVWFFEYAMLTGERSHVVSDEAEAILKGESQLVVPTTALDAATLLASAAAAGTVDPELAAHAEAMRPASAPAVTSGKLETDWHVGSGFVGQALGEVTRDQVDAVVNWALEPIGAIGPDAPEGTVLYVYIIQLANYSDEFKGYKWQYSAYVVLARDGEAIATTRATPFWIYRKEPEVTPAGFAPSADLNKDAFASAPEGAAVYWNLGPLVRSGARELMLTSAIQP